MNDCKSKFNIIIRVFFFFGFLYTPEEKTGNLENDPCVYKAPSASDFRTKIKLRRETFAEDLLPEKVFTQ